MLINENLGVVVIVYHLLQKGGKVFVVECTDLNETTWSYQIRYKNRIVHCGIIKKIGKLETPTLIELANELMIYEQKLESAKRAKKIASKEVHNV